MPTDSGEWPNVNLSAILEGLIEAGVEFILVGGLTAVVQGALIRTNVTPAQESFRRS